MFNLQMILSQLTRMIIITITKKLTIKVRKEKTIHKQITKKLISTISRKRQMIKNNNSIFKLRIKDNLPKIIKI